MQMKERQRLVEKVALIVCNILRFICAGDLWALRSSASAVGQKRDISLTNNPHDRILPPPLPKHQVASLQQHGAPAQEPFLRAELSLVHRDAPLLEQSSRRAIRRREPRRDQQLEHVQPLTLRV